MRNPAISSEPSLVVAVLAAGASRRLGRAKQLVPIAGEPLLRRQCRCALHANVGRVFAVLGSNADRYQAVISDLPVEVHVNEEWAEGLASTLRCAVRAAANTRSALLALTCDQYRIVPGDLRELSSRWRLAPSRACVSCWDQFSGPPVILPADYHDAVLTLRGDIGARAVVHDSGRPCPVEVLNPRAIFDLDCAGDLQGARAWEMIAMFERLDDSIGQCFDDVLAGAFAKRGLRNSTRRRRKRREWLPVHVLRKDRMQHRTNGNERR